MARRNDLLTPPNDFRRLSDLHLRDWLYCPPLGRCHRHDAKDIAMSASPGSAFRYAKARQARTHDALKFGDEAVNEFQMKIDRLEVDLDNAAIDYDRHFGRTEAIRKVRSILRILEKLQ